MAIDHGLEIYRWDGGIVYTSTDVTWNQIGIIDCPANTSVSRSFPAASGLSLATQQFLVNNVPDNQEGYSHTVTISGTTVSVSGGNQQTIVMVLGR